VQYLLFVIVVTGLSLVIATARARARRSWSYQLRLIVVLGYLDWLESPQRGLELSEVLVTAPFSDSLSEELLLARVGRCGAAPILFRLHEPLGDRQQLCARWYEESTPLLLATDDFGAVLHGPDGQLVGHLVQNGGAEPRFIGSVERR
jgi:hypothetical protein